MSSDPTTSDNDATPTETAGADITRIDPALTTTLAQASLAAYYDYEQNPRLPPVPPPNYEIVARFQGWDDWIGSEGEVERYGLIFRYCGTQQIASRFIVAFRGTDSYSDMFEDLFWESATLQPYRNAIYPVPDDVCSGFNGIYAGKGGGMTATMQQQIFNFLPERPSEVLITGHSLGGGLSQLFALDMAVSFPNVRSRTINFASPRVGGRDWKAACDNSGVTSKITRVINWYDHVPDFPVGLFDNYVSIGAEFQTAFYGPDPFPIDELPRHRLLNLQTVLNLCLWRNPQIWQGTFQDAVYPNYRMTSVAPPNASKDELIAKIRELRALELATRTAPRRASPLTPA